MRTGARAAPAEGRGGGGGADDEKDRHASPGTLTHPASTRHRGTRADDAAALLSGDGAGTSVNRMTAIFATICGNGRPVLCVGAGAAALVEGVQRHAAEAASERANLFGREEGADSETFEGSTRACSLAARMLDEERRAALSRAVPAGDGVSAIDAGGGGASLEYPLLFVGAGEGAPVSRALGLLAQKIG